MGLEIFIYRNALNLKSSMVSNSVAAIQLLSGVTEII